MRVFMIKRVSDRLVGDRYLSLKKVVPVSTRASQVNE